ncbi:MAG: hypothetical protein QNJ32_02155 [Xenococcaceae cyanobacterium MO_167.B27]|nr:hypothetical protein [Xenococcaceae cyanobacterium MO_167.B27]
MTQDNSLYSNYVSSKTLRKQWGKIRVLQKKLSGLRLDKSEKVGKNQVISILKSQATDWEVGK